MPMPIAVTMAVPMANYGYADASDYSYAYDYAYARIPVDAYCTVLYCTVLYCTVLHCTILYCSVLDCAVHYGPPPGRPGQRARGGLPSHASPYAPRVAPSPLHPLALLHLLGILILNVGASGWGGCGRVRLFAVARHTNV